jgi:branched-chain amino acid transport system permease protein
VTVRALTRSTLARHVAVAAVAGVALFGLSARAGPFTDFQLAKIAFYAIAIGGLTILTGLNGQLSLGHGALMAVGAYVTALLFLHTHLPVAVILLAAPTAGALAGAVTGAAAARLRGPYLAGATLALAVSVPSLATHYSSVLKGEQGIAVNPLVPPASMSASVTPERYLAWISLGVALVVLVLLANLSRSRIGRSFRAVRDDEVAAALAGINVARTQVLAFVVSAACAGLAGGLYALTIELAAPAGFTLALSIGLVSGMVVGGLGSLLGAVWGAVLLVYLDRVTANVSNRAHLSQSVSSNLSLAIYGVALIAVMLAFPDGIQGGLHRLGRLVPSRRAPSEPGARHAAA